MAVGERLLLRLEAAASLDAVSERVAAVVRTVVRPGVVEDVLSGTPIGHPLHPALVAVPVGALSSVTVLDAVGADARATRVVQAIGLLAAAPAAASGASDWLSTAGAERRVGIVHAGLNYLALALHGTSWWQRGRGRRLGAGVTALAGNAVLGAAGWLGGHLAYAQGVGVDTTAFQRFPAEWTDALAVADVPDVGLGHVEVDGVPVLVTRFEGDIRAYADRCTHRGAPLHEGTVADGCVTCPWHGGVFRLRDGSVASGPATRPQPALEVRIRRDRVELRRSEERTLRVNPAGR